MCIAYTNKHRPSNLKENPMNPCSPPLCATRHGLALSSLIFCAGAIAAPAADTFSISGQVKHAASFSFASSPLPLLGLPTVSETIGASTYTGVSLYGLLSSGAVGITSDPTQAKNSILSQYVVARGSDGYRVVFSGGELDPGFGGNSALPDLVAYAVNGHAIGAKGAFRTPVPEDVKGGRNVQNLVGLAVYNTVATSGTGGPAASFSLSGLVKNPGSYSDLAGLGLTTLTESVTYLSGGKTVNAAFTGVSLWSFLNLVGLAADPGQPGTHLGEYVVATASDGYRAVFSIGELDPNFGGASMGGGNEDMIAWATGDGSLLGSDGAFQLVVPGDVKGGRYLHNLMSLQVLAASVPEPGSVALVLAGLLGIAALRKRSVVRRARRVQ